MDERIRGRVAEPRGAAQYNDIDSALHFWGQAARHLRTFSSQVHNDGEARGRKWEVPAELELEIQKLFDHKAKTGKIPIAGGSHAIDQLKLCPKKGKAA